MCGWNEPVRIATPQGEMLLGVLLMRPFEEEAAKNRIAVVFEQALPMDKEVLLAKIA